MSNDRWDWSMGLLAHLDIETDGLVRPGQPLPLLLEVALVLTDADLRILDRYEAVIRHPKAFLAARDPHEIVVEMHEKSGLWDALRGPFTTPVEDAEQAMIALLDRHPDPLGRPVVWCGFSPSSVDRPMIGAHMPAFYKRIHYRTLDVSTLKLAMRNYAGVPYEETDAVHRAMVDTLEEIRVLRDYRSRLLATCSQEAATQVA